MMKLLFFCASAVSLCLSLEALNTVPPKEALQRLMDGNKHYVQDQLTHPNRSQARREEVLHKQEPFAAVLGCSDSRVSPTIIFDQGVGDLFIIRNAGNVIGDVEVASVQYAVEQLGSSLVMVLGHQNCGAVKAVLANQTKDIEPIAARIQEAIKLHGKSSGDALENAIKANVINVVMQLKKAPPLANLIASNKLEIVGGYYHMGTGEVELCCKASEER